jgi:glycosyltransferase involved in cell wall biosynthesis
MRWPSGVDGVYAYEDAALKTLSRAAAMGAARILDLPSLHWGAQERIWRDEMERWPGAMATALVTEPAWKVRRKEGELALANVACVASSHAHRVLEDAGIRKPIVVAPYGFPVEVFTPDGRAGGEPFTVVSVGAHDLRKGTPYLLEAWRKAGIPGARLRLVGPMRLTPAFTSSFRDLFEHVPHVSRAELPRFYRSADVLAFPTLGDGFGLVIQEAMCCGTPVLTTPCGGGPDCIQDGVEGWIVPPRDVDALVERLRWAAANRDRLAEMGRAARRRAERYDERAAGEALVGALERALGAGGNHGAAPGQPDRASTSS